MQIGASSSGPSSPTCSQIPPRGDRGEPTGNLYADTAREVMATVKGLYSKDEMTIAVATDETADARGESRRVRLRMGEATDEQLHHPALFVIGFIPVSGPSSAVTK